MPPELLEARQRRLSEFVLPAAVILAGVLIVVAFGFIVSRAVRGVGMRLMRRAAPLRRLLMQEAGGALGDLPRLLRGETLNP